MDETYLGMERFTLPSGLVLRVHAKKVCNPDGPCVIHNPTDHHMRDWFLYWRDDRSIFERICEHGVGHPDPDQFVFWSRVDEDWQRIHGCCGCCVAPSMGQDGGDERND